MRCTLPQTAAFSTMAMTPITGSSPPLEVYSFEPNRDDTHCVQRSFSSTGWRPVNGTARL
jgi:hypothetical protein